MSIELKNDIINNIIQIIKNEYLNIDNFNELDLDPTHYINEYQFVKYVYGVLSYKDPHFYENFIIRERKNTSFILNKYGYICIDIYNDNLDLRNLTSGKIVLDLRGMDYYKFSIIHILSVISHFDLIRNQLTNRKMILEIKKDNDTIIKIYYSNNKFIRYHHINKQKTILNISKIPIIKCDEILCIIGKHNLVSYIINSFNIQIYSNDINTNFNKKIYEGVKINKNTVPLPIGVIYTKNDYNIAGKIDEKYYPIV